MQTIKYRAFIQHDPAEVKAPKDSKYLVEFVADVKVRGDFAIPLADDKITHSSAVILAECRKKFPELKGERRLMVERVTPIPRFN